MAEVRAFNRFWTREIGVLQESMFDSPHTLTEARVLYELANQDWLDAAQLCARLDLDPGHLSRILARFRQQKLLRAERSEEDGRRRELWLTPLGRAFFDRLDARSASHVATLLKPLDDVSQQKLVAAMASIRDLLDPQPRRGGWHLRGPAPGELGWIVARHGAIYGAEYGWDARFEGLVARVVADFAKKPDPGQQAWIAEVDGEPAGSILCTRAGPRTAQLRLLLVEPRLRGLGIGARLVEECVGFARAHGYAKMILWTNSVLHSARRLYERAGFVLVEEAPHHEFGEGLIGQTWCLAPLTGKRPSTPSKRRSRRR